MSPQREVLKIQTCVLKVHIHCQGCKRKVKKLLNKVEGVYAVEVDAEQGRVTVSGTADPTALINKLAKSGKHAELLEPEKVELEQKKNNLALSTGSKVKIIQPGGDGNKVPKGMKVIKEVRVVADQDEPEIGDNFSLLDGKDGGGGDEFGVEDVESTVQGKPGFGQGKPGKGNEGKSVKKVSHQDGKKGGGGHIENVKNKLRGGKAKSGSGGGGTDGLNHGQGVAATKMAQMGQMGQMPFNQANMPPYDDHQQHLQHPMAAAMINRPVMGGDGMIHHPMVYARADNSGRPPLPPPPPAANPLAHIFSDENANGCTIM